MCGGGGGGGGGADAAVRPRERRHRLEQARAGRQPAARRQGARRIRHPTGGPSANGGTFGARPAEIIIRNGPPARLRQLSGIRGARLRAPGRARRARAPA